MKLRSIPALPLLLSAIAFLAAGSPALADVFVARTHIVRVKPPAEEIARRLVGVWKIEWPGGAAFWHFHSDGQVTRSDRQRPNGIWRITDRGVEIIYPGHTDLLLYPIEPVYSRGVGRVGSFSAKKYR